MGYIIWKCIKWTSKWSINGLKTFMNSNIYVTIYIQLYMAERVDMEIIKGIC